MLIEGIEIREEDLCILSTASLQGFGFVNVSGIKVKHLPTGLSAVSTSERSQHANRTKASKELALLLKERQYAKVEPSFQEGQKVLLKGYGNNKERTVTIITYGTNYSCVQAKNRKGIVPTAHLEPLEEVKPKTIRIGNYDVPEPLREAPEVGTYVYVLDITHIDKWIHVPFGENPHGHRRLLIKGLLHLSREAVELHAKALLSFTTTELNDA